MIALNDLSGYVVPNSVRYVSEASFSSDKIVIGETFEV